MAGASCTFTCTDLSAERKYPDQENLIGGTHSQHVWWCRCPPSRKERSHRPASHAAASQPDYRMATNKNTMLQWEAGKDAEAVSWNTEPKAVENKVMRNAKPEEQSVSFTRPLTFESKPHAALSWWLYPAENGSRHCQKSRGPKLSFRVKEIILALTSRYLYEGDGQYRCLLRGTPEEYDRWTVSGLGKKHYGSALTSPSDSCDMVSSLSNAFRGRGLTAVPMQRGLV